MYSETTRNNSGRKTCPVQAQAELNMPSTSTHEILEYIKIQTSVQSANSGTTKVQRSTVHVQHTHTHKQKVQIEIKWHLFHHFRASGSNFPLQLHA